MPIYIGKQPLSLFKMRLPWGYHPYKNVDGVNMAIMSFGGWLVRRDLFYWISNRHKGEFFLVYLIVNICLEVK